jgi:ABC-2 type transport system ATP-binding protein
LAYVPADVALWPGLTGAETLELLADIGPGINRRYRDELIQRFELEVDRKCGTYSTGNRQKVAQVAAFATDAPLLIFDEPTSGLDPLMANAEVVVLDVREPSLQEIFLEYYGQPAT